MKNKGFVFPSVVSVITFLVIFGLAFIYMSAQRRLSVYHNLERTQAFWLAEAGLERTKEILKMELINGSGSWADGISNEVIDGSEDIQTSST
ncbi:MAG: hypothetical protein ACQESB_07350, partial [Elusimicrobiota bacterium]